MARLQAARHAPAHAHSAPGMLFSGHPPSLLGLLVVVHKHEHACVRTCACAVPRALLEVPLGPAIVREAAHDMDVPYYMLAAQARNRRLFGHRRRLWREWAAGQGPQYRCRRCSCAMGWPKGPALWVLHTSCVPCLRGSVPLRLVSVLCCTHPARPAYMAACL